MPAFSAFVLFATIWFLTLFVVLPIRLKTQGDVGEVTPGTQQSTPADPQIRKRFVITTIVATAIWAVVVWIIVSGAISLEDMDILYRLTHP